MECYKNSLSKGVNILGGQHVLCEHAEKRTFDLEKLKLEIQSVTVLFTYYICNVCRLYESSSVVHGCYYRHNRNITLRLFRSTASSLRFFQKNMEIFGTRTWVIRLYVWNSMQKILLVEISEKTLSRIRIMWFYHYFVKQ